MNIPQRIRNFTEQNLITLKHAPVEMAVALYLFIIGLLLHHKGITHNEEYICLAPVFLIVPFLCNKWFPSGRLRLLYYVSALIVIPFWWIDIREWIDTPAYPVTVIICVLAVLLCGWLRDNRRFTGNVLRYTWDAISAAFLTGVAYLLLLAIFFSVVYIFDIFHGIEEDFCIDTALLFFVVLQTLVFLTLNRNPEQQEGESSKLFATLLNWVLSPAVLAYTLLLYLYFAKIVATWTLPRGGIAYLVFGFTLIAVAAQAGQTLLHKRYYDWFYRRFSLIALPALAMFWVGVACRWSDYGLTENRVYLIVCGLIMTACIGLFFRPKTGRYLYVTLFAVVALALFTYIPGFTARDIEKWSQTGRPERERDGIYDMEETGFSCFLMQDTPQSGVDLNGYKRLYELRSWNNPDNKTPYLTDDNDTLTLYDASDRVLLRESFDKILETQLAKIGRKATDTIPCDTLEHYAPQLLDYRTENGRVLFRTMNLRRDSLMRLHNADVKYYLGK